MDDIYAINAAKSEFREAYNAGDVDRLLAVFHPTGFTDMSDGGPSAYGREARNRLRKQATSLFLVYSVRFNPIIIQITVRGDIAYDYGWHEFVLTPRDGREPIRKRERYFEVWTKDASGSWKISQRINNQDVREELGGVAARWFLSEENSSPSPASF